ncbi:MAG: NrsF family protein [Rhodanobacter sp.]
MSNESVPEPLAYTALIDRLGGTLRPVRRLAPPWRRTVGWLLAVVAIALGLLAYYGTGGMLQRWVAAPDLEWAGLAAVMTAICAAWAALALAVPGRRVAWAWLPLPPALVWLGASGLGCLRVWFASDPQTLGLQQSADCLLFIMGLSIPLSALLIGLLRRACPLRPVLTAVLVGLASAAASAALLEIGHAANSAATDLLTHLLAVAVVVAVNAVMGGRLLSRA